MKSTFNGDEASASTIQFHWLLLWPLVTTPHTKENSFYLFVVKAFGLTFITILKIKATNNISNAKHWTVFRKAISSLIHIIIHGQQRILWRNSFILASGVLCDGTQSCSVFISYSTIFLATHCVCLLWYFLVVSSFNVGWSVNTATNACFVCVFGCWALTNINKSDKLLERKKLFPFSGFTNSNSSREKSKELERFEWKRNYSERLFFVSFIWMACRDWLKWLQKCVQKERSGFTRYLTLLPPPPSIRWELTLFDLCLANH